MVRDRLMARDVSDRCTTCGLGFLYGPVFTDFIEIIGQRGLRRTHNFEYRFYARMFGHDINTRWPSDVTLADCDSIFLGCVVDSDMKCPKCGHFAFAEGARSV
jgi:hypothetical protein